MKRIIQNITGQDSEPFFNGKIACAIQHVLGQNFIDYLVDSTFDNPVDAVYIADLSDDGVTLTVIQGNADNYPSIFEQWPVTLGMTTAQKDAYNAAQAAIEAANLANLQKDVVDTSSAKAYAKLTTLKNMSPAEIQTWATANITTLAQARDALITLAIAVSILARRL